MIKDKIKRTCGCRQLFCHAHTTAEVLEEFACLRLNVFVRLYKELLLFHATHLIFHNISIALLLTVMNNYI